MANFEKQRSLIIDEILKYLKIDRAELRVFKNDTLYKILNDLKEKRESNQGEN